MLRFQIFGFPVAVHWVFWLITALLGGAAEASSPAQLQRVVIWVACVFASVLWHELGHAFMMRYFGDRNVQILLYGGGGLAMGRAFRTRFEQVVISLAGPVAGLALGLLTWFVFTASPPFSRSLMAAVLGDLLLINIVWSLVNLLPIIPLDGGRISEALLARKGLLALRISLVCAVLFSVYAFAVHHSIFTGLLFAAMAMDNWRALNGRPTSGWMGR